MRVEARHSGRSRQSRGTGIVGGRVWWAVVEGICGTGLVSNRSILCATPNARNSNALVRDNEQSGIAYLQTKIITSSQARGVTV